MCFAKSTPIHTHLWRAASRCGAVTHCSVVNQSQELAGCCWSGSDMPTSLSAPVQSMGCDNSSVVVVVGLLVKARAVASMCRSGCGPTLWRFSGCSCDPATPRFSLLSHPSAPLSPLHCLRFVRGCDMAVPSGGGVVTVGAVCFPR